MDGLKEVISHAKIKDKHRRKTACLWMLIIFGGSRGIPSEAGVIPLIKPTYRISSWLRRFIERKHSSWLLEQSPNLLLYAFWSQCSDSYAALHRFHPGHLIENGLSLPCVSPARSKADGMGIFRTAADAVARLPEILLLQLRVIHYRSLSVLGEQFLNKKWAEQSWSQNRSAFFMLRTNCLRPQTYRWYMKLCAGYVTTVWFTWRTNHRRRCCLILWALFNIYFFLCICLVPLLGSDSCTNP